MRSLIHSTRPESTRGGRAMWAGVALLADLNGIRYRIMERGARRSPTFYLPQQETAA